MEYFNLSYILIVDQHHFQFLTFERSLNANSRPVSAFDQIFNQLPSITLSPESSTVDQTLNRCLTVPFLNILIVPIESSFSARFSFWSNFNQPPSIMLDRSKFDQTLKRAENRHLTVPFFYVWMIPVESWFSARFKLTNAQNLIKRWNVRALFKHNWCWNTTT